MAEGRKTYTSEAYVRGPALTRLLGDSVPSPSRKQRYALPVAGDRAALERWAAETIDRLLRLRHRDPEFYAWFVEGREPQDG